MRLKILILLVVTFCAFAGSAQTPTESPQPPTDYRGPVSTSPGPITASKQISGGVLNGKAQSLAKPQYPPAARAIGASGPVTVQVLIDENGYVISAKAISGHPLLRIASEEAARRAVFSPTLLQGQPVKVSGVVTYNYVMPMTLARIGFVMSFAQESGSFGQYTLPESLAREMPASWNEERELIKSITYELPKLPETPAITPVAKINDSDKVGKISGDRYTAIGSPGAVSVANGKKLDQRSLETLQQASTRIADRFAQDERSAWNFALGRILGRIAAEPSSDGKLSTSLTAVESLAGTAPASVSPELVQMVRDLVAKGRQTITDGNGNESIVSEAERLSNKKF